MTLPLPRRTAAVAHVGCFTAALQPSPTVKRVGVRNFTFVACSGFTRVAARVFAALPFADLFPRSFGFRRPGSFRGVPTTPRTELSSAGSCPGSLSVPGGNRRDWSRSRRERLYVVNAALKFVSGQEHLVQTARVVNGIRKPELPAR